jgi:hypothetical protein
MRRKLFARRATRAVLAAALLLGPAGMMTSPALARDQEKEHEVYDARLEGYKEDVTLPLSATGLSWVLLVIFGAVALVGLFKDAKRSHLD